MESRSEKAAVPAVAQVEHARAPQLSPSLRTMEFRIEKAAFLQGLYFAQGIADRKATMPILANVLLRTDGVAKLTDYGIARVPTNHSGPPTSPGTSARRVTEVPSQAWGCQRPSASHENSSVRSSRQRTSFTDDEASPATCTAGASDPSSRTSAT